MAKVIMLGANGSGKSTIGRELARILNCAHFDAENYWFHKTETPYTVSRSSSERNAMFLSDIKKHNSYVVSGSVSEWDEAFLKLFDLAVFLEVPTNIRIERIENRERTRFDDRVCKGGDMYDQHIKFIEYARNRDISLLKKKALRYSCPVIYIDGTENYNNIAKKIKGENTMNSKITEIEKISLKGISKKFSGKAANRFYQEHIMWADHHDDVQNAVSTNIPGTWYGIWDNGTYWIARKAIDVGNKKLDDVYISSDTYAIFESDLGNHAGDELPKLRDYIFDGWLPTSGYRQSKDYEVEVYHLYPPSEKEKRHYEIWIPIEKI